MPDKQNKVSRSQIPSSPVSNHTLSGIFQPSTGEIFAENGFPECQCMETDPTTGSPILCPVHDTLPTTLGGPAIPLITQPYGVPGAESVGAPVPMPRARSPSEHSNAYRFTPPMSLEDFPRPANIARGESLATVLEERYQVRLPGSRAPLCY
jgi:hypothetical protein